MGLTVEIISANCCECFFPRFTRAKAKSDDLTHRGLQIQRYVGRDYY